MTDGVPNGNPEQLNRAINRTRKMVDERKLTVFPIGIGNESDMSVLDKFSPGRKALKLQGMKFQEFLHGLVKVYQKLPSLCQVKVSNLMLKESKDGQNYKMI